MRRRQPVATALAVLLVVAAGCDRAPAPPKRVLRRLEIIAHGAPLICDGLDEGTLGAFVTGLKGLRMADQLDIYLTGCNTGLSEWRHRRYLPPAGSPP